MRLAGHGGLVFNQRTVWKRCQERAPVGLRAQARIEDRDNAAIGVAADQASEALAELQHRNGQREVAEPVSAIRFDRFAAMVKVLVNQQAVKPAREIRVGDMIALRQQDFVRTVAVRGLSHMRGPAPAAQLLHEETPQSVQERLKQQEQHRLSPEPALSLEHGRPTKRERRDLERSKGWGERWSASIDD